MATNPIVVVGQTIHPTLTPIPSTPQQPTLPQGGGASGAGGLPMTKPANRSPGKTN